VTNVLPNIVEKTREKYVLPSLASYVICTTSFELWMFCGGHDTFAMVVSSMNNLWEPTHVIVRIFEVNVLLDSFGLLDKVITYVKDKGSNLSTLISTLTHVVTYFLLQLISPFVGSYFGHAMSKAYQYASNDSKVCAGFS
jgi:hypothetical protein